MEKEKITEDIIKEMFTYQPWTPEQIERGKEVRDALIEAVKVIVKNVPESPDRSVAIRKIREARMDCNHAIIFNGRF